MLPSNGTYLTVPEYLQEIGMTESEYLSPQWSNALELIALQRAIEAYDYDLGHTRPNGDSCWTAQYNGFGSWGWAIRAPTATVAGRLNTTASGPGARFWHGDHLPCAAPSICGLPKKRTMSRNSTTSRTVPPAITLR